MSDRIIMRIGESLVAGGPPGTAAEPEVAIGEMDGRMGTAFANLLGNSERRVEHGERILKDHSNARAAQATTGFGR